MTPSPYILTKKDEYVSNILEALSLATLAILLGTWIHSTPHSLRSAREEWTFICSSIVAIIWNSIAWYKYIKLIRNEDNFKTLVINENGIVCDDEDWKYTLQWKNINKIIIYHNRESGLNMRIDTIDKSHIIFCLTPYSTWLKKHRLIQTVRFFSQRHDIIEIKKSVWFLDLSIPIIPLK